MGNSQSQRPLTDFLSWLIQDPERVARYSTPEGFQQLMAEHQLSDELQRILRDGDLRAAQEVIRQETGERVIGFILHEPYSG
jgi:hypothetical protein